MTIKTLFIRLGFDARALSTLRNVPRYARELRSFKRLGGKVQKLNPILSDYEAHAGTARGAYFHQDLLVASFVHARNPRRHIDVGSRVDGFVAHVAAFRRIEVLDVRSLPDTGHNNISFFQANLMDDASAAAGAADSVSSLHALEHFGLGRYGDPLDPDGHLKGFRNLVRMVSAGGYLYLGLPISSRSEVQFNSQRVFSPTDVLNWDEGDNLLLRRFDFVDDDGILHCNVAIDQVPSLRLGCGIYSFQKKAA